MLKQLSWVMKQKASMNAEQMGDQIRRDVVLFKPWLDILGIQPNMVGKAQWQYHEGASHVAAIDRKQRACREWNWFLSSP